MEKHKCKWNDCIGAYRRTGQKCDPNGSYTGNCDIQQNRNNDSVGNDSGYRDGNQRQNPYGNVFLPPFMGTTEAGAVAGQMGGRFEMNENVDYGIFTGNTERGISDGENNVYLDSVFADRGAEKPVQDADDL